MSKLWLLILAATATLLLLVGCEAQAPSPTATSAPAKATTAPAPTAATTARATTAPALATPGVATTAATTALSGADLVNAKFCARCHGVNGEGGFGPVLAGTQATAAQAIAQVRNPRSRMPSFNERQVSDAEIGRIVDYYKAQPKPATAGTYRFSVQPTDPAGQKVFVEKGCANCHGIPPNVAGTKLNATEEITQVRTPRARMGAFRANQITDGEITTANEWLRGLPPPPTPTPAQR